FRKGETELVIVVTPYLVKPTNAADIALPTDGFRAPNELQRLLGNMESDGENGVKRPGPTAAPEAQGSAPQVGALTAPEANEKPSRKSKRDRKRSASATAAPGFSLK
ncbi:MAG: secretion system protein, partial [Sphingomonadaceae bacterium]|nr:secretion system protein [Sphingomonadaceae bacterium]